MRILLVCMAPPFIKLFATHTRTHHGIDGNGMNNVLCCAHTNSYGIIFADYYCIYALYIQRHWRRPGYPGTVWVTIVQYVIYMSWKSEMEILNKWWDSIQKRGAKSDNLYLEFMRLEVLFLKKVAQTIPNIIISSSCTCSFMWNESIASIFY